MLTSKRSIMSCVGKWGMTFITMLIFHFVLLEEDFYKDPVFLKPEDKGVKLLFVGY